MPEDRNIRHTPLRNVNISSHSILWRHVYGSMTTQGAKLQSVLVVPSRFALSPREDGDNILQTKQL